jgi:antitoxin ParD1/3/4
VVLTDYHQDLIETLVGAGRYQNASEVLRDGLRLVEEREARRGARLKALSEAARDGFGAVDRGEYLDFQSFDDLERHLIEITEPSLVSSARRA